MGRFFSDDPRDVDRMLRAIGVSSIHELFEDIPREFRLQRPLEIPGPLAEWELMEHMRSLASRNLSSSGLVWLLGAGCYNHHVFAAVEEITKRAEFLTAYTPYQPEASQGTLQALFEFQTYVARLTGMDVANSSMYDGATALAEATLMAARLLPERKRVVMPTTVHPIYRKVVRTIVAPLGLEIVEPRPDGAWDTNWKDVKALLDQGTCCLVVQNPNFFGTIEDLNSVAEAISEVHRVGGLAIYLVIETTSLGLLRPPGELGADIVVGEGQSLGLPMAFGGPHVGLFATRRRFLRQMPGRVVGQTVDSTGQRGYVLTLATREQHIRREKATSNICTNQALCALAMAAQLALLGPQGLRAIAVKSAQMAREAIKALVGLPGVKVTQKRVYNEFVVWLSADIDELNRRLLERGIVGGLNLGRFCRDWEGNWLLAFTEKNCLEDIKALTEVVRELAG